MDRPTQISREDLLTIQNARANINYQKALTEKAELQCTNIVLRVYMKYGLTPNDGIDFSTGQIMLAQTDMDEELQKQDEERRKLSEPPSQEIKEENEIK